MIGIFGVLLRCRYENPVLVAPVDVAVSGGYLFGHVRAALTRSNLARIAPFASCPATRDSRLATPLHVLERCARPGCRSADLTGCSGCCCLESGRGGVTPSSSSTRNRRRLAPAALPARLGPEEPARRQTGAVVRRSHPDPFDVGGQSAVGCTANPRRALEARNRRQSIYGREVHGPTAKATVSDVAYLPRQPCDATDGGGLLRRADGDVPAVVRAGHSRARPPAWFTPR